MEIGKRLRPSKKWMVWMGAAAVVSVVVLSLSIIFMGPDKEEKSGSAKVNAMRPKAVATVGGSPATEAYNEKIKAQNELMAEQAKKEGKSVIPTVTGAERRPNVTKVEPAADLPKEVPETIRSPRTNTAAPPEPKRGNGKSAGNEEYKEYKASLLKDLKQILNTEVEYQPAVTIAFAESKDGKSEDGNSPPQGQGSEASELPPLPFKSGDLLYASNEIYLNSDVPSPVVVTVASGAFKGAMFFGGFKRHEKYMLLQFDRLKTPAGDEYPVDAIALDPEISSAAVRSDVDSHYMERWGGLIAASFLEGFGDAVSRSGKSYKTTDTSETIAYPEYDTTDQAWIAAGKVGERLAGVMEQGFSRSPTVYAYSGEMFAIMILSTKR